MTTPGPDDAVAASPAARRIVLRRMGWRWFASVTGALVVGIVVLALGVAQRDGDLPGAADCPSAPLVRQQLSIDVGAPTAQSTTGLLVCYYAGGASAEDVAVVFSLVSPGPIVDPCAGRAMVGGVGAEACVVSTGEGPRPRAVSLLVEMPGRTGDVETQITAPLDRAGVGRLAALAGRIVRHGPPGV